MLASSVVDRVQPQVGTDFLDIGPKPLATYRIEPASVQLNAVSMPALQMNAFTPLAIGPTAPMVFGATGQVFTAIDPTSASANTDIANALFGAQSGLTVNPASMQLIGASSSIGLYDGSLSPLGVGPGLLITSGTMPGTSNTDTGFGADNAMLGDADLDAVVNTVFATQSYDASSITFSFNNTDPNVTGISFNAVFGTDEYPEWVDAYVDIAAVMVNGVNVAFFGNDPAAPLSVIGSNLAAGYFVDNQDGHLPIEYDGMSNLLMITAPVHMGMNTIKIAIADTGDHILDSGLFLSNFHATNVGSGGVTFEVPCTEGNDDVVGTVAAEHIDGLGGDDRLDGGVGNDIVLGGAGNDRVSGGDGNDFLEGGDGVDVVRGRYGDDVIQETSNDTIDGGAGFDTLKINHGASSIGETMVFGSSMALGDGTTIVHVEQFDFTGGSGDDFVKAGKYHDVLNGGAGNDTLKGNIGDDRITGGAGADKLYGGAGADTFVYTAVADSTATNGDTIYVFNSLEGDIIDMSAVKAGHDHFKLVSAFTGHDAQLVITDTGHGYLVEGDANGDYVADFSILVMSQTALTASDLML